jgi:hypothetical protein
MKELTHELHLVSEKAKPERWRIMAARRAKKDFGNEHVWGKLAVETWAQYSYFTRNLQELTVYSSTRISISVISFPKTPNTTLATQKTTSQSNTPDSCSYCSVDHFSPSSNGVVHTWGDRILGNS